MILAVLAAVIGVTLAALVLRSLWVRLALNVRQTAVSIGVVLVVVALLALTATGRLNWIVAAVAAGITFAQRAIGFARLAAWLKSAVGGSTGRPRGTGNTGADGTTSTETAYLAMTLHHASGHIDGEIKQGRHRGRFLSELALAELLGLLREMPDFDSQRLLETYLDRAHPTWRTRAGEGSSAATMSRTEALETLGLTEGATHDDIVSAHRRLIQRLHPDRGGSTYLAALLNRAKDLLLDER